MTKVKIKENSWLAKMAARNLKSTQVAMVIGRTIHLYNSTKEEFLSNKRWACHEIAHVRQYAEIGFFKFIFLYLLETFNKGYQNNKFEVEARRKERNLEMLNGISFV